MRKAIPASRVRSKKRKKPGPPRTTGPGEQVVVRLHDPLKSALDEWRAGESDTPTRAEAIRRLLAKALGKSAPQLRRALELLKLLASSPHGATEALLVRAHGFNSDMVDSLVSDGLATAERETMKAGAKPVEIVRIRITDAGRKAIEE
jgi:hypothetical protein